jgi:hypothetical protein
MTICTEFALFMVGPVAGSCQHSNDPLSSIKGDRARRQLLASQGLRSIKLASHGSGT